MKLDFRGKTILITGGTHGIGKQLAKDFLKLNGKVICTTTNIKKLKNKKNLSFEHLDFNDHLSTRTFFNRIKKINKIDVLINNAGINKIDTINKIQLEDWHKIHNVNVQGPLFLTKEVSKIMLKKGKGGKIINISSIFGVVSREKRSMYSASKSALLGLTRASALDLSKHNVLVNSVSPGFVNTSLTRKILGKKGMKNIIKEIPIKRMATTKDISNLIIFLCSNYNSYITGQNFIIDGGVTCK